MLKKQSTGLSNNVSTVTKFVTSNKWSMKKMGNKYRVLAKEWTPKKVPVWRLQACIKKHGQYVGIAISNNYFACLTWFVAIAFRLFGADVKNLWFARSSDFIR